MSTRDLKNAPWRIAELATGAKSFEASPILGNPWLNRLGLHVARVRAAHAVARMKRAKLKDHISSAQQSEFDRNGFVVIHDFLPDAQFKALVQGLQTYRARAQEKYEGETVQRRMAIDEKMRSALPAMEAFAARSDWRHLLGYAAARDVSPALYIQSLFRCVKPGVADPQTSPHADTFHPTAKMWFFLTDVARDDGAFCYAPGSHRITPERLAWEKEMSLTAREAESQDHREGSFRVSKEQLKKMGYDTPAPIGVPKNTLVVADTYGFHARGPSKGTTTRVELWAMARRSPFLRPSLDTKIQNRLRKAAPADPWLVRENVTAFEQAVPLEQHAQL